MKAAILTGALIASLLAGCVAPEADAPPALPAPENDSCGAAAAGAFIGQGQEVLAGVRFAQPVRVISPGQAVTMDYHAGRLNIELDEAGRITRMTCG